MRVWGHSGAFRGSLQGVRGEGVEGFGALRAIFLQGFRGASLIFYRSV